MLTFKGELWSSYLVKKHTFLNNENEDFFNSNCGGESNWVHSALRPPVVLLCQPRVIMMMENLAE
jgi:hypothetical protein